MRTVLSGAGFVIRIGRREGACGPFTGLLSGSERLENGRNRKNAFPVANSSPADMAEPWGRKRLFENGKRRSAGMPAEPFVVASRTACPGLSISSFRPLPILVFPARRVSTGWPGALYRKSRGLCRIFRKRSARSYDNKSGRFVSGRLSAGGAGSVGGPDARNYLTRNVRPMRRIVVDRMPFKRQMLFTVVP